MRKGQAAMEFLMTYGWAILVVLIAIGALAYFGVLNPSRFLPNSCTLFPGVACGEFKVKGGTTTGWVALFLRNGIGDSITITSTTLDAGGCTLTRLQGGTTNSGSPVGTLGIGDGNQTAVLNFSGCNTGTLGSRFRAGITMTYYLGSSGSLTHTRTGSIIAQVE